MDSLAAIVDGFKDEPLVVLGDLVADEYIHGTTSRISREAPVLIVREERRTLCPGGAANVVANLRAMGANVRPVGVVGDDPAGAELIEDLARRGVDCRGVLLDEKRFTTCKTRVLAGGRNSVRQQMLRLDRLNPEPISAAIRRELAQRLAAALAGASGLVVSDYGEGVVEAELLEAVLQAARAGTPVWVDSRMRIASFLGVAALTPNEPELQAAAGIELDDPERLERAGRWLLETTGAAAAVVKRGRSGMALFLPGEPTHLEPAFGSDEVADVTGAGDTVLAAWSLACAAGADDLQALRIANTAGGVQVTKAGTAVVEADELRAALADAES